MSPQTSVENIRVAMVREVRYKKKTVEGNAIYEIVTGDSTFRTAANSRAGTRLSSRVYASPRRVALVLTSRGTVRDFRGSL